MNIRNYNKIQNSNTPGKNLWQFSFHFIIFRKYYAIWYKPYPCKICKKSFRQMGDLKRHEKIHANEKPHSCQHCTKSFHDIRDIKRLERIHTENPYSCKICKKSFRLKCNLEDHHSRIHNSFLPVWIKVAWDSGHKVALSAPFLDTRWRFQRPCSTEVRSLIWKVWGSITVSVQY